MGDTADTKAVAVVDLAALPSDDLAKAREMAKAISVEDSQSIVQYGISAQVKISGFADTMLGQIPDEGLGRGRPGADRPGLQDQGSGRRGPRLRAQGHLR